MSNASRRGAWLLVIGILLFVFFGVVGLISSTSTDLETRTYVLEGSSSPDWLAKEIEKRLGYQISCSPFGAALRCNLDGWTFIFISEIEVGLSLLVQTDANGLGALVGLESKRHGVAVEQIEQALEGISDLVVQS